MTETFPRPRLLIPGEHAPSFRAPAVGGNPDYVFNTAAGRPILMLLFGSASHPACRAALDLVAAHRAAFDDETACFFGISIDAGDVSEGRIAPQLPGVRFLIDADRRVSMLYGAAPSADDASAYQPHWLLLDRTLQVAGIFSVDSGEQAMAALAAMKAEPVADLWAPVLNVPRVFEADLCRRLIALYDAQGGTESGFMREEDGRTVLRSDPLHKRRRDHVIADAGLRQALVARIHARIVPRLSHAFQYQATRIERHIVACYDADGGGYFRPHRDNTTRGTAHRRFAVTINLNPDDYDGGDLRFPEYGPRSYRASQGGAVIFSCSILHEVLPVTRGRRYCYLPFLYDDAGAALREANNRYLDDGVAAYRAG